MCGWKMVSAGNKSAHSSELKSPTHLTQGATTQMSSRKSLGVFWNPVSRRLLESSQPLLWLLLGPGYGGYIPEAAEHRTREKGSRHNDLWNT